MTRQASLLRTLLLAAGLALAGSAIAQNKQFSFAYDQPKTSEYGFGADTFS
jgi:hypothetical protein